LFCILTGRSRAWAVEIKTKNSDLDMSRFHCFNLDMSRFYVPKNSFAKKTKIGWYTHLPPYLNHKVAERFLSQRVLGANEISSKMPNSDRKPASIKDSHKRGGPRSSPPPLWDAAEGRLWRLAFGPSLECCSKAYNSEEKPSRKTCSVTL
jgi:hypothetical protein